MSERFVDGLRKIVEEARNNEIKKLKVDIEVIRKDMVALAEQGKKEIKLYMAGNDYLLDSKDLSLISEYFMGEGFDVGFNVDIEDRGFYFIRW